MNNVVNVLENFLLLLGNFLKEGNMQEEDRLNQSSWVIHSLNNYIRRAWDYRLSKTGSLMEFPD